MKAQVSIQPDWQLTRERFHISSHTQPPAVKKAVGIGAIIAGMDVQADMPSEAPATLKANWPAIVGAHVAKYSDPAYLKGSRLYVYVRHSGWISEMKRLPAVYLLRKIASLAGAPLIDAITYKIDPAIQHGAMR